MRRLLLGACGVSLLLPAVLLAGKLTLKDGTVYEGAIKKLGSSYSVRLDDGTMKLVSGNDVASVDDPTLGTPAAGSPGTTVKPGAPGATPSPSPTGGSADFAATARQADRVDTPLFAVTLWQKYIDNHAAAADLPQAKAELKKWQDWAKTGAEKVKGKWVAGEDLKKLHEQVNAMMTDALRLMQGDQTLKGVAKLQDVLKVYPNSFPANFEMGYYYLLKISGLQGSNDLIDKSIGSLETAVKLKPNSPEALSNLAIAYNFRRRYEDAVLTAYKAAQMKDDPEIVQNLINAINYAPPGMRANNPKVKPVVEDAHVMAARRGIGGPSGKWTYVRPEREIHKRGDDDEGGGLADRHGIVGSGTGFFIADSGYILTNRHVAAAGDKMIVVLSDGTQRVAQKVVVDDEQDIAVLKIDTKEPLPFIKLAAYDEPPVGTDVTVMGFPLGAAMGMNVKITRGVVTSIEDGKQECDVIVDAQVNPGNSGGPMLDKYGNLMALVAMKTLAIDESISSYGLGISRGRLKKFFEHQKDKLAAFAPKMTDGTKGATVLTTEDIAQKFTKATVMVLIVAGDLPEGLK